MRPARLNPITRASDKDVLKNHARILSGNISYGNGINGDQEQNINGVFSQGIAPVTPNTTFSVAHVLGRVPLGFHTIRITGSGAVLSDSGTAWTATTISLQCNVASAHFTIFIF